MQGLISSGKHSVSDDIEEVYEHHLLMQMGDRDCFDRALDFAKCNVEHNTGQVKGSYIEELCIKVLMGAENLEDIA